MGRKCNPSRDTSPNNGYFIKYVTAGQPPAGLLTPLWVTSHDHTMRTHTNIHEAWYEEVQTRQKNTVTFELTQLHKRNAFRPVRTEEFSEEKKHESLASIMLLKEK